MHCKVPDPTALCIPEKEERKNKNYTKYEYKHKTNQCGRISVGGGMIRELPLLLSFSGTGFLNESWIATITFIYRPK